MPGTSVVYQGDRKRPVCSSHNQGYRPVWLGYEPMHFLVFDDEGGARFRVFRWIAGREDILCGCSQDVQGRLVVLGLHGRKESAAGIVRGGKAALSGLLGERSRERTSQRKRQKSRPTESNKSLPFIFNKNRNSLQHVASSPFLNSRQVTHAGTSIN